MDVYMSLVQARLNIYSYFCFKVIIIVHVYWTWLDEADRFCFKLSKLNKLSFVTHTHSHRQPDFVISRVLRYEVSQDWKFLVVLAVSHHCGVHFIFDETKYLRHISTEITKVWWQEIVFFRLNASLFFIIMKS